MFCAVAQELKLKPGRAQKLATGFGGGIARQGLACGALTGAAMAVGLALGRTRTRTRDKEARDRVYALVAGLERDFLKKAGAFNCRKITGLDFRNPEDQKRYTVTVHRKVCAPIVAYMVMQTVKKLRKI